MKQAASDNRQPVAYTARLVESPGHMEYRLVTLLKSVCCGLALLGSHLAWAEQPARPPSVMFDQSVEQSQLTTAPGETAAAKDRCAELSAQMEALKGKPQRRHAVAQQYEAECKRP
jgi:hypothetical protein